MVGVHKRVGKSVRGANVTDAFYGCKKVEETFWFCNLFTSKTQRILGSFSSSKGMQSFKLGMGRGTICQKEGVLFLSKMVCKKGKWPDLAGETPGIKLC